MMSSRVRFKVYAISAQHPAFDGIVELLVHTGKFQHVSLGAPYLVVFKEIGRHRYGSMCCYNLASIRYCEEYDVQVLEASGREH